MQYQRQGDRVQLRFLSGETLSTTLLPWLSREHIGHATVTGLGAVRHARVSYWNSETRQYETHELTEQMEVVSLVGNVTLKDGQPFVHAHVNLGRRDLSVVGGHLNDLTVHPTLELWLRPEKDSVKRELDEASGLYVMHLAHDA
jgi:predicted DNA-binding protein with PD1-like motif